MSTSALVLWWACILFESLILFRAVVTPIVRHHPFFCIYFGCVWLSDIALFWLYLYHPGHAYQYFYWGKEFVCVIAGYALVLEIIRVGFGSYAGAKKLATNIALVLFACMVALQALQSILGRGSRIVLTSLEVERNLRAAELFVLGLVIVLLAHYRVGLGRNLKGIIVGYGLTISIVTMSNALGAYAGTRFFSALAYIRSYSYMAVLLIWLFTLWSYHPNPVPKFPKDPPQDYDRLASSTKDAIDGLRGHIGKAARP